MFRRFFLITDEAGRFLFLRPLFFFISSKTNEAPFLFIFKYKNIDILILTIHMNKINEATFFLFKSEKKTNEGHLKQMREGQDRETIFFYLVIYKDLLNAGKFFMTFCRLFFFFKINFFKIFLQEYHLWYPKVWIQIRTDKRSVLI